MLYFIDNKERTRHTAFFYLKDGGYSRYFCTQEDPYDMWQTGSKQYKKYYVPISPLQFCKWGK